VQATNPGPRPPIRVVVSDDAFLMRSVLGHLLSGVPPITVVGECDSPDAVPRLIDEQRADALITDIRMPPAHHDEGIQLAARLRQSHPALGVIVLST
jgi:DNA-binding NarL/FixJ family response regulator